jgi:hypothetical protein
MLQVAGDQAPVVLLIRPDRWQKTRALLLALFEETFPKPMIDRLRAQTHIWSLLRLWVPFYGDKAWPPPPTAWDQGRPVVVALMEPPPGGPSEAIQGVLSASPMSFSSRALVPSRQPRKLARELYAIAKQIGCRPLDKAGDDTGPKMVECSSISSSLALIPESGHVRIEAVHDTDISREDLRLHIGRRIHRASARTPATHYVISSSDLIAGYVRPWQFRRVAVSLGAVRLTAALAGVDPKQRFMLLSAGIGEILQSYLTATPMAAELEDVAFGVSFDQRGVRLRSVATLTEKGAKLLEESALTDAAQKDATKGQPSTPSSGALLDIRTGIDLDAVARTAALPIPGAAEIKNEKRIADQTLRDLQSCGSICYWHLLLSKPFGTYKLFQLSRKQWKQRDLERLRRRLKGEPFAISSAALPPKVLSEYRFDLKQLNDLSTRILPSRRPLLRKIAAIRGRSTKEEAAIWSELLIELKDRSLEFSRPERVKRIIRVVPPLGSSRAMACLGRLNRLVADLFKRFSRVDPSADMYSMRVITNRAKTALACALEDPLTRSEARGFQALITALWMTQQLKRPTEPPPQKEE